MVYPRHLVNLYKNILVNVLRANNERRTFLVNKKRYALGIPLMIYLRDVLPYLSITIITVKPMDNWKNTDPNAGSNNPTTKPIATGNPIDKMMNFNPSM